MSGRFVNIDDVCRIAQMKADGEITEAEADELVDAASFDDPSRPASSAPVAVVEGPDDWLLG